MESKFWSIMIELIMLFLILNFMVCSYLFLDLI